jgi:hypothetical protein
MVVGSTPVYQVKEIPFMKYGAYENRFNGTFQEFIST